MTTREAAERWRDTWQTCWQSHDPEPIIALYTEDAYFQSHPFRDPQTPRDYIQPTLEADESAECEFSDPIVDGDRAAVPWRATTQLRDGGTERLVGVSLLRFGADGLVTEQRDVWAMP